jgi:hypothetical protein
MASDNTTLVPVGTLTIANGAAVSNSLAGEEISNEFGSFVFIMPAALTEASLDLEVSADDSTWTKYEDPPATVVTMTAAKSYGFIDLPFPYFRVKTVTGSNEGAERIVQVFGRRK